MKFALIIFDADGTLRRCTVPGKLIPTADDEWELLPGVKEKLAQIEWGSPRHGGVAVGVASNQSWVAKGKVTEGMARQLLANMIFNAVGFQPPLWAIELCPHLAGSNCKCRKPRPYMLREIMGRWGVDPDATLFVGDLPTDRQAAEAAGCWFAWAHDFIDFQPPLLWRASRGISEKSCLTCKHYVRDCVYYRDGGPGPESYACREWEGGKSA